MRVSVLIPSYKRPEEITLCLAGLLKNLDVHTYTVIVGFLKADRQSNIIKHSFSKAFNAHGIAFNASLYDDNIGKAQCLNKLFQSSVSTDQEFVVTLDNDMFIKKPIGELLSRAASLKLDLVGFGSRTFWVHLPPRNKCSATQMSPHLSVYQCAGIGGGMMLFPRKFLASTSWEDHNGVYGGVDGTMCLKTKNRAVLYWDADWMDHNCLKNDTPELKAYEQRKVELLRKTKIFPKGWDEC